MGCEVSLISIALLGGGMLMVRLGDGRGWIMIITSLIFIINVAISLFDPQGKGRR